MPVTTTSAGDLSFSFENFTNRLAEGTGRLKARVMGPGSRLAKFGESARSYLSGPKAWLESGPLLSKALERADRNAIMFGDYRPLANLAGKRSLYSRVMDASPGHQRGMQEVKFMLGMPSGYAGSGFEKSGKLAKSIFEINPDTKKIYGGTWGVAGRTLPRLIGPAFLGYSMYEGYKKGGAWGAVGGGVKSTAEWYMFGRLLGGAVLPATITAAATAGTLGVLGKMLRNPDAFTSLRGWARPWTSEYRKEHAGVQMGTPSVDPFGNNATMRQRSLNAIQNSRLNGRTALSNEAALSYQPYFR